MRAEIKVNNESGANENEGKWDKSIDFLQTEIKQSDFGRYLQEDKFQVYQK